MKLVSPKEFAIISNLHINTVYALARKGKLPATRLGKQLRIDLDAVNWNNYGGAHGER